MARTDVLTPEQRSRCMSKIAAKDTRPEMITRRGLHARGWRYVLHSRRLPGRPDLAFPARRAALFVHGCFWHGHGCHLFRWPATNGEFWRAKIARNKAHDENATLALLQDGWRVGVIWECALKGKHRLDVDRALDALETWLRSDLDQFSLPDSPQPV